MSNVLLSRKVDEFRYGMYTLQLSSFSLVLNLLATEHNYVICLAGSDPLPVTKAFQTALMVYHSLIYLVSEKRSWG